MDTTIPNLRHLSAFREVARLHSVSKASSQVHLSQPAITQAIAKLEQRLETPLFERRSDGMFTTEPGALFFERVDRALDMLKAGVDGAIRAGTRKKARGFANFQSLLTTAQLRALIAVSDAGNFSLAARTAGISQPSLHRAARDLERLSGLSLFAKTSQGIDLTPAAAALAQHAKLAFAELEQGFAEVEEWRGLDTGRIVVGTMPLARTHILPVAINVLLEQFPHVHVSVVDGPYDDLLHGLRHGEIDILVGALRNPPPIEDIEQRALFEDSLSVVARAGHPLAQRRSIGIGDLAAYPWVIPRKGTPTRAIFDELFAASDDTSSGSPVESSSLTLIRGLLLESDRIALLSTHQIQHEQKLGLLATLPFTLRKTERPIGLTLRRNWRPTGAQKALLDALREAGRQAQRDGTAHIIQNLNRAEG